MVKDTKKKNTKGPKSVIATIHLHKHMHDVTFKRRAPKAVKVIKKFGRRMMGTNDVRVDPKLNKFVWSKGIKGVPFRARIRLDRKRNEDEDAKKKLYTVVTWVPVTSFKGLQTEQVEAE
eukprot:TRINITY_DN7450_c0_g1_i1.p1 TRINITY_DN7450_c0_g1~~TRINITY_DN7450_c0_g1_i1.p1  ORF type:complete len:119 (+),score=27.75 TRINITY_DN7450_c0_g1_i1:61-417(+)